MSTPGSKAAATHPSDGTADSCLRARSGPGQLAVVCGRNQRVLLERRTARVDFHGIDEGGPAVVATTPCDLPGCCVAAPASALSFGAELRKLLAGLALF